MAALQFNCNNIFSNFWTQTREQQYSGAKRVVGRILWRRWMATAWILNTLNIRPTPPHQRQQTGSDARCQRAFRLFGDFSFPLHFQFWAWEVLIFLTQQGGKDLRTNEFYGHSSSVAIFPRICLNPFQCLTIILSQVLISEYISREQSPRWRNRGPVV